MNYRHTLQDFVAQFGSPQEGHWIGLRDIITEDTWIWEDGTIARENGVDYLYTYVTTVFSVKMFFKMFFFV